ncbi:DUF4192 domain-containing protein [Amycolatopsis sp. NPDC051903]|uniref:DUF4192 domain-containing protein n=1 Tax=Amycolatopsis sp. NPDC051903 TaxID=3363936 RepID=UPI003791E754
MTTSTPPGTARAATLTDPAQLIASLPYLLGFTPADSVVLLGHRAPGTRVGLILRADLPPRELVAEQADSLVPRFIVDDHVGVTAVLVGGRAGPGGEPPHAGFAEELRRAFHEYELPIFHPLWTAEITAGAPWQCYRDAGCGGKLPDPRSTVVAATTTKAGFVAFRSREEVEALLEPRSPEAVARRRAMLSGATPPWRPADELAAAAAEIRTAFFRHRRDPGPLSDDEAVRLAHATAVTPIRDACLATAVPADSPVALAAADFWLSLVRELPAPHRAQVASLLAYAALMRGEGVLAGLALTNAVDADPEHVLARLLRTAWDLGTRPSRLAGLASLSDAVDLGLSAVELAETEEPPPSASEP